MTESAENKQQMLILQNDNKFAYQALLNQAKNSYQNKKVDVAIECLSKALKTLELNPEQNVPQNSIELYLFRSKCYSSIAKTLEAVQDAQKAILEEKKLMDGNPNIQLCDGYYARAEARFLGGDFEEALVDYDRCAARRRNVLYDQGIAKAKFNIRKAFEFTIQQVSIAEQALWKGVLLEEETKNVTFKPECNIVRYRPYCAETQDLFNNATSGFSTACTQHNQSPAKFQQQQQQLTQMQLLKQKELLIPTSQIQNELTQQARKRPMYKKLAKLTEDKEFLEYMHEIKDMPFLKNTKFSQHVDKAISFINEREKYWKDQNNTTLDTHEIKPQPEKSTKSIKNIKDFQKYSEMRRQSRLNQQQNLDVRSLVTNMLNSKKCYTQSKTQQIAKDKQIESREEFFNIYLLNIKECINNGCDMLAEEFVDEFFKQQQYQQDEFYIMGKQIKILLLFNQGQYNTAMGELDNISHNLLKIRNFKYIFTKMRVKVLVKQGRYQDGAILLEKLISDDQNTDNKMDAKILLSQIYYNNNCFQQSLEASKQSQSLLKERFPFNCLQEDDVFSIVGEIAIFTQQSLRQLALQMMEVELGCYQCLKMQQEYKEKEQELNYWKKKWMGLQSIMQ